MMKMELMTAHSVPITLVCLLFIHTGSDRYAGPVDPVICRLLIIQPSIHTHLQSVLVFLCYIFNIFFYNEMSSVYSDHLSLKMFY